MLAEYEDEQASEEKKDGQGGSSTHEQNLGPLWAVGVVWGFGEGRIKVNGLEFAGLLHDFHSSERDGVEDGGVDEYNLSAKASELYWEKNDDFIQVVKGVSKGEEGLRPIRR